MSPIVFSLGVNPTAGDEFRPVHTLNLDAPGVYSVRCVELDNKPSAWTAWKTQNPPETGWLNQFWIIITKPDKSYELIYSGDNTKYATPDEALNAAKPVTFTFNKGDLAFFCILDSYDDDSGGLNLEIHSAE